MPRTNRMLELLIVLQTKPRFTVEQLAEQFSVSRRTMLRDLHALSEMGVPLAATPGPGGGYMLIRERRLLPLSLTPDEAIGMVLSYESFLQYAESPFSLQSMSAITKLRNALPPESVREIDRIRRHVVVMEAVHSPPIPLLAAVLRASVDGVHLDTAYDSPSGIRKRRIFPHGLYASHGFWYCVCHDDRRQGTIILRIDRLLSTERVEGLERPPGVDVREWLRTHGGNAEMLALRARVTRRGARNLELETIFGAVSLDEHGNGILETEIPASEIDYYAARLLTLGADLYVESPSVLVDAIRRQAEAIAELYASWADKCGTA